MSMVFGTREVSTGPTIGFQGGGHQHQQPLVLSSSSSFQRHNNKHVEGKLSRFSVDPSFSSPESSSSIDVDVDSDDDDDQEEESTSTSTSQESHKRKLGRQSSSTSSSLCSMQSMKESLPIKRGLSNFFMGRSRSFVDLSEATSVETLAKAENPFNKRRRTLMACKWSREGFYSSRSDHVSMPLLKLDEEEEVSDEEDEGHEDDEEKKKSKNMKVKMIRRFKPVRCFSLTDLHHEQQHKEQNV